MRKHVMIGSEVNSNLLMISILKEVLSSFPINNITESCLLFGSQIKLYAT